MTEDDDKWPTDSIFDSFPGGIIRVSYTGDLMTLDFISEGTEQILGYSIEEFKDYFRRFSAEPASAGEPFFGKDFVSEAVHNGKELRKEYTFTGKDGKNHWIEIRSAIVSQTGNNIVIQYVLFDIDEQKKAEELVKKEHERLEVVAGLSADSVFEYNIATDCMRYYNRKEILIDCLRNKPVVENYTHRILDGSILNELFHPDDKEKLQQLCEDLRTGKPDIYTEIRKQYEKDKYTWVSVEAKTILNKQGIPSHVIGKISNIDEKIKQEQEIKYQMERDQLTGLYNRKTVNRLIAKKLADGVTDNSYLVLTDVDEFEKLNDTMGKLFGDGVLCTFANSMVEFFPESIIGRSGGDEFIAYLEGLSQEEIYHRIKRINRRLLRIHGGDKDELKISVSFGLAKCNRNAENKLDDLIKKADVALCYIKKDSKENAMLYDSSMKFEHEHRTDREEQTTERGTVLHTEGDIMLYAHELFDTLKDIRGALRLISDVITRFYHFNDILYVHRRDSGSYEILYHWGENNIDQFCRHPLSPKGEPDWEKLLYNDKNTEYVVLKEEEFVGENVNKAKSMLSFRIQGEISDGYCVMIDRVKNRDWQDEVPMLLKLAEFVVKRYFMQLEKKRKEEEAEYKSKYDRLTGVMNLTYFATACEQYMNTHDGEEFALLYTDFTNFKYFNETYGYSEGNKMLKEYAEFLKESSTVFVCRIAADSFVSLYRIQDAEQLKQYFLERGEQFCAALHRSYNQCRLGITGGITMIDRRLDSIYLNMDNANAARKSIKKDTTVQIEIFTAQFREEQKKQINIVSHMTEALKNHEFKAFLQPKIDMVTGKVVGAEALVRWVKPDGSMIAPGDFIPIFEENGFVTQIDFEILRQVLVMQEKRMKEGKPISKISINFSRKHQDDKKYLERLDELLSQFEVPTDSLEIEITESVFMQDLTPLIESVRQLKKRGFSVSIDDFGAGYSSLNVLSRVKADIVKLDRQFLLDIEMEKDNYTSEFLQLLINMIQKLGFSVLAEGVETKEQVVLLKNAGCRFAQGFYYAKPMPTERFLEFLDTHEIEDRGQKRLETA